MKRFLTKMPRFTNDIIAYLLIRTNITQNYQPLSSKDKGMRSCIDRLEAIKRDICEADLCLDVGSNTGFFSNEISKLDVFTIGLESELKNVIVAKSQFAASNLVFKQFQLDIESVNILPRADIILFLSVFHHLVKYFGKNEAVNILKILATKCDKQFFFETGQPDETGTKWCGQMGFLGNIDEWVNDFFINQCKFQKVKYLGSFETFLSSTKRKLFLAVK